MLEQNDGNYFGGLKNRSSLLSRESILQGIMSVKEQLETKKVKRPATKRRIRILCKQFPAYIPPSSPDEKQQRLLMSRPTVVMDSLNDADWMLMQNQNLR